MSNTNVYGVSVDSRSRNVNEPDNRYTVLLKRTLDRVKSVQLGSFQFQDARYAFDDSTLKYSEPVMIPANTIMRFVETTRVLTKATGALTTSTRTLTMILPPTMNQITSMNNGTQELTTASNHGLFFGVNYYPSLGLRMSVVGGDFPQDLQAIVTPTFPSNSSGPVLTSTTTVSPYFTGNNTTLTWAPSYLNELTGGVGSAELRMIDDTGTPDNYHSYIHAPPPTLVELFTMLNAAVADMSARVDLSGSVINATNATPIVITSANTTGLSSGDEVVISGVGGNTAANGTFFITALTTTTFSLDGSAGNGVYTTGGNWTSPQTLQVPVTFGFNNVNNTIAVSAPTRTIETSTTRTTKSSVFTGSLASLLGYTDTNMDPPAIASIPSSIVRTVNLKDGTFSPSEVDTNTTYRLNPGDFSILDADDRTFFYTLPTGVPTTLVIDYGRYSGTQLAAWMTFYLNPLPAQLTVSYNTTDGKFTFTHNLGLTFSLDFVSSSQLMAERLGFDQAIYNDASSYTSVRPGVFGVSSTAVPPTNRYTMLTDETNRHYTFHTDQPTRFYTESGTSTLQVGQVWTPLTNNSLNFAHHFQPGDIIIAKRPTLSGTQNGTKNITAATNASPIVVTTANAHGLNNGDNITLELLEGNVAANGTWTVANVTPTTFELNGSTGNGTYTAGTGRWWTNVSLVTGTQKNSAVFEVVVQSVWDASTGAPLLTLEPTASVFSTQDAGTASRDPLGTPDPTDGIILMVCARRNVFMLHFEHPEGSPSTFGFPPLAWPPSQRAMVGTGGEGFQVLTTLDGYDANTLGVPVSSSYTSPLSWNLKPPDYILVVIKVQCASQDIHSHSYRGSSFPIFAKLLVNSPYINVSEEMHFTTFAGHGRFNSMIIEFQNPDGTPVQFNGRPHTYTLLFTLHEDTASLPCM
jgi:hypothetical protein